jgi:glutaminyl-tRNA synthetase
MNARENQAGSNDQGEPRPADAGEAGAAAARPLNFIELMIEDDLRTKKWQGRVHTRFPPEPNGYLHIGHAKSI